MSYNILSRGGVISIEELENCFNFDWKEWEITNLGNEISENEKINTYYRQIPYFGTDFESDKQYLVFMNYDEENDIYEIKDVAYGIMEYDPETQMVKNIDTGEFVEIDWSLIEQN